jgi:hypothetical protein
MSVGSFCVAFSADAPIFVLLPIFRKVDPRLRAQSAEYGHRTRLRIFIFIVPKTEPLPGNEGSPKSACPQQLPISMLYLQVNLLSADMLA